METTLFAFIKTASKTLWIQTQRCSGTVSFQTSASTSAMNHSRLDSSVSRWQFMMLQGMDPLISHPSLLGARKFQKEQTRFVFVLTSISAVISQLQMLKEHQILISRSGTRLLLPKRRRRLKLLKIIVILFFTKCLNLNMKLTTKMTLKATHHSFLTSSIMMMIYLILHQISCAEQLLNQRIAQFFSKKILLFAKNIIKNSARFVQN